MIAVGPLLFGWAWLALRYPNVCAAITGIVLLFVFGLFTAKVIFKVQNNWTAIGLSPLFGGCWIAFFYVAYRLLGV
jgi:hypothetical protein